MKKGFLIIFLSCLALCHGKEKNNFAYGDIHAMSGYAMIGLGFRAQEGMHAFDFSINACPLNPWKSFQVFHLRGLYLLYPVQRGLYMGGGFGLLNEPETMKKVSGSFEAALGYQGKSRLFFEVNALAPFEKNSTGARVWPGVTLGSGF